MTELDQIELSIEEAKKGIEFSDAAKRMSEDKDFKRVIIDGYMRDEAARLAGMLAEESMTDEVNQRELQSSLKAIGHLRQYLINANRIGDMLKQSIVDAETVREEILAEG